LRLAVAAGQLSKETRFETVNMGDQTLVISL